MRLICFKGLFTALLCVWAAASDGASDQIGSASEIRATIDFERPLGRINPDVFGTNYIGRWSRETNDWVWSPEPDPRFQRLMEELACPIVRIHLMDRMDKIFPSRDAPPDFTVVDGMAATFLQRPGEKIMFCFTSAPGWIDMTRGEDRVLFAEDCVKLADYLVNEKHYPIVYWDFYNEPYNENQEKLNVDPRYEDRSYWKFYNLLADRLHAVTPQVKVGGPGVASPNLKAVEDFLSHCAPRVDFITWHHYLFGKEPTSTESLMAQTSFFANDVRNMRALAEKYIPDRRIELILGEYNMCWAWTPTDPRQATPIGAVWGASVLKNLIDAKIDAAMTWHAYGNSTFGLISETNELRPFGQLLEWMNRWVAGAMQVQADSSSSNLEVLAASSDSHDVVLLINKSASAQKVSLTAHPAGGTSRSGMLYQIADGQSEAAQSKIALFEPGQASESIEMSPYSLNLYVLDRVANATSSSP
jgi:hypothetical protein